MTSLAFILGVVPLVLAKGAGAEMRSTLGVAVFFGMLGVTFFGIFLTPVFYYLIATPTHKLASANTHPVAPKSNHDSHPHAESIPTLKVATSPPVIEPKHVPSSPPAASPPVQQAPSKNPPSVPVANSTDVHKPSPPAEPKLPPDVTPPT